MLLHRLMLNPRAREVRRDIADPREMHRTLMSMFPPEEGRDAEFRARHGVLHRVEPETRGGAVLLLVQTGDTPDWDMFMQGHPEYLLHEPESKALDDFHAAIQSGDHLLFRLRANVTRRMVRQDTECTTEAQPKTVERDGRTLTSGVRRGVYDEAERLRWLERKGQQHGFSLLPVAAGSGVPDVRVLPEQTLREARSGGAAFASALFEGRILVDDAEKLRAALVAGIGSAKAFGFGLLTVKRA